MGMNRRRSRGRRATLVKSLGVGCGHFFLMSIEGVAQGELNMAFGTGQGKTFRIIGGNQKSDDGRALRLAGGIALQSVAGGDDGNILQYGGGLGSSELPLGVPVRRISTRVPGPTKPATETTSFTRTETARIPGGIRDGQTGAGIFRSELAGQR